MPPNREHGPGARDDERGLERELRDLGASLDYPPTPDLAHATRRRLEEGEQTPRRGGFLSSLPSPWWAAAAAVVLVLALPVLSSDVRSALSEFFTMGSAASGGAVGSGGGGGAQGGRAGGAADDGGRDMTMESGQRAAGAAGGEETMASVASGARSAGDMAAAGAASVSSDDAATACAEQAQGGCAEESPSGKGLGLGEKIPLREARARSEAPILLPRSPRLGKPGEAYDLAGAPGFVFLYRASLYRAQPRLPDLGDTRIGLLLTQTPGDVGAAYLPGGTVEGAGLETVSVNGEEGYWIPASGDSPEVARSAGLLAGVLLWERDGQALRLEADVSKEEAVRIAESVR